MGRIEEDNNRRLLRARDAIDRHSDRPLDIDTLAGIACCSPAHFIRSFKAAFGETPHHYLQRRRIERAMTLLRTTELSVSEVCVTVGLTSFATFTRTFREVVGMTPTEFRRRYHPIDGRVPTCFVKAWTRPARSGSLDGSVPPPGKTRSA